jgi:hypothetical protein
MQALLCAAKQRDRALRNRISQSTDDPNINTIARTGRAQLMAPSKRALVTLIRWGM